MDQSKTSFWSNKLNLWHNKLGNAHYIWKRRIIILFKYRGYVCKTIKEWLFYLNIWGYASPDFVFTYVEAKNKNFEKKK